MFFNTNFIFVIGQLFIELVPYQHWYLRGNHGLSLDAEVFAGLVVQEVVVEIIELPTDCLAELATLATGMHKAGNQLLKWIVVSFELKDVLRKSDSHEVSIYSGKKSRYLLRFSNLALNKVLVLNDNSYFLKSVK